MTNQVVQTNSNLVKARVLRLSEPQMLFFKSDKKYVALRGGVGSGKTFIGSLAMLRLIYYHPLCNYLIAANTHNQLMSSTILRFMAVCDLLGVRFKLNKQEHTLRIGKTIIFLRSLENYHAIRGLEVGGMWLDEVDYAKMEAVPVASGRVRDKRGRCVRLFTSSPNGYGFLYEYFHAIEKPKKRNRLLIRTTTYDNQHNLDPEYVQSIIDSNDKKMIRQELLGEFVNVKSGRMYYEFDRDVQGTKEKIVFSPDERLCVGMDFNVNPMTAVVGIKRGDKICIFDEIYLNDSNTNAMCLELKKRYKTDQLDIVPDSTAIARSTKSDYTDIAIIENHGFNVIYSSNPTRHDRFNLVNNLFNKRLLEINVDCKMLIKDLDMCAYDNKDENLGHISDALGYLCYSLSPMNRKYPKITSRLR